MKILKMRLYIKNSTKYFARDVLVGNLLTSLLFSTLPPVYCVFKCSCTINYIFSYQSNIFENSPASNEAFFFIHTEMSLLGTWSIGEAVSCSSSSLLLRLRWASSSPSSSGMPRSRAKKLLKIISVLSTSSLNHTIPHRDTVASVAYFKSWTSNIIRTFGRKTCF